MIVRMKGDGGGCTQGLLYILRIGRGSPVKLCAV